MFYIKRGDREPPLTVRLLEDGVPIDLTGSTVTFVMRLLDASAPKASGPVTVNPDNSVTYSWGATDTDTEGDFPAEWKITDANGHTRTVPNKDYFYVKVGKGLS